MTDMPATDRRGLSILSLEECERLLGSEKVGRVAVMTLGEPQIVPVLYRYYRGAVVFRTAAGEKLDVMSLNAPVAFQIDGWDLPARTGWSVLARGRTEEIYDQLEIDRLETIGLESWVPSIQETRWVKLYPSEITGRRIG
ncbi:MAG: pyridoxamine 5'-phosphate oxidase family protein [Acidimicrobiia bacterium]